MKPIVIERLMYCPNCQTIRNFKKEKQGKGQPATWWCPKCGYSK